MASKRPRPKGGENREIVMMKKTKVKSTSDVVETKTKNNRKNISSGMLKKIGARQRWRCIMCRHTLSATFQIDHRDPLHNGGADEIHNMDAICSQCHRLKTHKENLVQRKDELLSKIRPLVAKYMDVVSRLASAERKINEKVFLGKQGSRWDV